MPNQLSSFGLSEGDVEPAQSQQCSLAVQFSDGPCDVEGDPSNLSISVEGGKENNCDCPSNGE